ncbi:MAG TPA: LptA/OstA family protein [Deltaproteobacteria bacterium]|jgi:lipopolysaccharide export system protein LptA|nr:LptA/OstA family protein [Deltaproteobacteria bacterium]HQI01062.1 LptA/OstA family protein [Deltaproteobacteria bacterium]
MQKWIKAFLTIFAVSLLLASQASAEQVKQPPAKTDTIDVEADRMDVNKARGTTVFSGNVKATQGDVLIKGAVLTLYSGEDTGKIEKMVVEKNVYIKWQDSESTCEKAVYTPEKKYMELIGNVIITRGQDRVSGQKVTIDMVKDIHVVEGGRSGRVKLRVNSGSKESGVLEWKK